MARCNSWCNINRAKSAVMIAVANECWQQRDLEDSKPCVDSWERLHVNCNKVTIEKINIWI